MNLKKLHLVLAVAAVLFIMLSFSSNPPNGRTGAPFDGACTDCHTGSGGGLDGEISLDGLPSVVDAGETYSLTYTISVTQGSPVRAGIQSTIIFDSDFTNAGDMDNPGLGSSIAVHTPSGSSARDYLEHSPAQFFGGNDEVEFTVDWTAPSVSGDVTVWTASVLGNGSGSGGDNVLFEQFMTEVTTSGAPLEVDIDVLSDVTCFEDCDASAIAEVSGGVPPYEFDWSSGENTATAEELCIGNNFLVVTDDAGSEVEVSFEVDGPDEIDFDVIENDVVCNGESNGSWTILPEGGTGVITCNGDPSCTESNLAPGTYFVTLEDANGCEAFAEIEIEEPTAISVVFDTTNETFAGAADGTATADPEGGVPPYDFLWSNGDSGIGSEHTTTGLSAGSHQVTITDDGGCVIEGSVTISAGSCTLSGSAQASNVSCFGEADGAIDLTVSNGSGSFVFNWSNGATTEDISDLEPGLFSVTVLDETGCDFEINNIAINQPQQLVSTTNSTSNTVCEDDETGEIIIAVGGGSGDLTINWNIGITNDTTLILDSLGNVIETVINLPDTLTGLTAGVYTYELIDGSGCSILDTVVLESIDDEAPTPVFNVEATVYLDENGVGILEFDDIDAGSFDNCGVFTTDFEPITYDCSQISTFTLTTEIMDDSGNVNSAQTEIIVVDTIAPVIDCSMLEDIVTNSCGEVTFPTPTATDNCQVAEIAVVEGFESGSIFPSGTTTVVFRATDDCGYFSECSFTVTVNVDLAVNIETSEPSCFDGIDGSIDVVIVGGTPPYELVINPEIPNPSEIPAGSYSVNVTDASGCFISEVVEIGQPDEIIVEIVEVIGSDPGEGAGSIDIEVNGGVEPFSYNWFDTNNTSIATTQDVEGLEPGLYTVEVTDANGCISAVQIEVQSTTATFDPSVDNIDITVSPNPSFGIIRIEHQDNISSAIEVISIDGSLVKRITQVEQNMRVDLSELGAGLYLIRSYHPRGITIKQFLKL